MNKNEICKEGSLENHYDGVEYASIFSKTSGILKGNRPGLWTIMDAHVQWEAFRKFDGTKLFGKQYYFYVRVHSSE